MHSVSPCDGSNTLWWGWCYGSGVIGVVMGGCYGGGVMEIGGSHSFVHVCPFHVCKLKQQSY